MFIVLLMPKAIKDLKEMPKADGKRIDVSDQTIVVHEFIHRREAYREQLGF